MFRIEDDIHAELQEGAYTTFDEAMTELRRRARLPWNETPNIPPCTSWRTCERKYTIIEYDESVDPWHELRRTPALSLSAKAVRWLPQ